MIERIAESAVSQSASMQQVTQGMEQISEVVQTNASTAQESAKLARELQNQAEDLKVSDISSDCVNNYNKNIFGVSYTVCSNYCCAPFLNRSFSR